MLGVRFSLSQLFHGINRKLCNFYAKIWQALCFGQRHWITNEKKLQNIFVSCCFVCNISATLDFDQRSCTLVIYKIVTPPPPPRFFQTTETQQSGMISTDVHYPRVILKHSCQIIKSLIGQRGSAENLHDLDSKVEPSEVHAAPVIQVISVSSRRLETLARMYPWTTKQRWSCWASAFAPSIRRSVNPSVRPSGAHLHIFDSLLSRFYGAL